MVWALRRYELQESKMLSMSTRRHEYGRQTRDEAAEVSPRCRPMALSLPLPRCELPAGWAVPPSEDCWEPVWRQMISDLENHVPLLDGTGQGRVLTLACTVSRVDGDMQMPLRVEQGTQAAWMIWGWRKTTAAQSTVMTVKTRRMTDGIPAGLLTLTTLLDSHAFKSPASQDPVDLYPDYNAFV